MTCRVGTALLGVLTGAAAFDPYVNQCPVGPKIGCAMHKLAYEFATTTLDAAALLPPGSRRRRQVWDSLFTGDMEEGNFGGGKMGRCNQTAPAGSARPTPPSPPPLAASAPAFFVAPTTGSDTAAGTQQAPFRTVARAVNASRAAASPGKPRRVVLRSGMHFLASSLSLGPEDSGLVLENAAGEEAWLSGAAPLSQLQWSQYRPPSPPGSLSGCGARCLAAGHCCVNDTSSYLRPSCAMVSHSI